MKIYKIGVCALLLAAFSQSTSSVPFSLEARSMGMGNVAVVTADIATAENAAVEAAEAWLKILDSGQYEQAREQAALLLRSAVPPQQWETSLGSIRKRMGALVSRKVMSKNYMTEIPKAPPAPRLWRMKRCLQENNPQKRKSW